MSTKGSEGWEAMPARPSSLGAGMHSHNSTFRGGTRKTPHQELPEPRGSFPRPDPLRSPRKAAREGLTGTKAGSNAIQLAPEPLTLGNWICPSSGTGTGRRGSLAVTSSSSLPAQGFKAESSKICILPIRPRCPRSAEANSTRDGRYASGWPLLVFLSSFLRFWDMKYGFSAEPSLRSRSSKKQRKRVSTHMPYTLKKPWAMR